jgi:hypothetical protein
MRDTFNDNLAEDADDVLLLTEAKSDDNDINSILKDNALPDKGLFGFNGPKAVEYRK